MGMFNSKPKVQTVQDLQKESEGILDVFSTTITQLNANSDKAELQRQAKKEEAERLKREAADRMSEAKQLESLIDKNGKIVVKMEDFLN